MNDNSRYSAIVRAIYSTPWAIMPDKLEAICAFIHLKVSGGSASPDLVAQIRAENEISAARAQNVSTAGAGSVAVMPLYGIINQRYAGDFWGPSGTSVQQFTQQFRQAVNDPNVKAIVIDVDSPGGSVSGVDELASEIFQARSKKQIIAVSNSLCASAAYYIASQASEMVVSPSSLTGSIGVYSAHEDDSEMLSSMGVKVTLISAGKYKVEGNNFEPLGDGARAAMQGMVDSFYGLFVKAVARGRGVKASAVQNGFGEGRVLTAGDAVKAGMADRIGTLDDVLGKLGVKNSAASASFASPAPSASAGPVADVEDGDAPCSCPCSSCQSGDCSGCSCEGCDSTTCGCEGCACSGSDPDSSATAQAARSRRLRLARL